MLLRREAARIHDTNGTRAEVVLLLICAFLRIAAFVLVFNGLLAVAVVLDNPLGDDSADLPALAYHSYMKKECDSFSAAVDAIETDNGWWEGLCESRSSTSSSSGGSASAGGATVAARRMGH